MTLRKEKKPLLYWARIPPTKTLEKKYKQTKNWTSGCVGDFFFQKDFIVYMAYCFSLCQLEKINVIKEKDIYIYIYWNI